MAAIKVTNDNFETVVLQTNKPVLIDFYGSMVRTMQNGFTIGG